MKYLYPRYWSHQKNTLKINHKQVTGIQRHLLLSHQETVTSNNCLHKYWFWFYSETQRAPPFRSVTPSFLWEPKSLDWLCFLSKRSCICTATDLKLRYQLDGISHWLADAEGKSKAMSLKTRSDGLPRPAFLPLTNTFSSWWPLVLQLIWPQRIFSQLI